MRTDRTTVEIWIDPACLWSWVTWQWLTEVAPRRDLDLRIRPYSLLLRSGPEARPPWQIALWSASLRGVRVLAELDRSDPESVAPTYEAMVRTGLAAMARRAMPDPLAGLDLPDRVLAAADDPGVDAILRRSMTEVVAIVGQGIGTPALVVRTDPPGGLLGPVMTAPVTGDDALRLWDAVALFASLPALRELSRPRSGPPAIAGLVLPPVGAHSAG